MFKPLLEFCVYHLIHLYVYIYMYTSYQACVAYFFIIERYGLQGTNISYLENRKVYFQTIHETDIFYYMKTININHSCR